MKKENLIEIGGKFYNDCQVIILPIKRINSSHYIDNICKNKYGTLNFVKDSSEAVKTSIDDINKPYYFYIISNEIIREGNYFIRFNGGQPEEIDPIRKCENISFRNEHFLNISPDNRTYKKIIATNDPEIGETNIPKSFIQDYYQLKGLLTRVLVEYHEVSNSFIQKLNGKDIITKICFIEPMELKANDPRVLINGNTVRVDYRIISEENYQLLLSQGKINQEILNK